MNMDRVMDRVRWLLHSGSNELLSDFAFPLYRPLSDNSDINIDNHIFVFDF